MSTATMTSKGQITIPSDVRNALGLKAGDRIEFFEESEGKFLMVLVKESVENLKGMIKATKSVSIEEMNQVISESWAGKK